MPLLLSLLISSPSAHAAELRLQVGPGSSPRSMLVMSSDAAGAVAVAPCRDDGAAGDAAADGIWTCEPLSATAGGARVAVALDGELTELGSLVVSAAGTDAEIALASGTAVLDSAGGLLTPQPGATPRPPVPLLVLRASGDFGSGAPMLRLSGSGTSGQAGCRDDGNFPDRQRNDGELGCAAPISGASVTLALQAAGAGPTPLGTFDVDGSQAVLGLTWAAGDGKASADSMTMWPWPAEGMVITEPEPGPEPTPGPAPEPVPGEAPEPVDPGDPTPPVAPGAIAPGAVGPGAPSPPHDERAAPRPLGGAADQQGRGLLDLMAVLGALAIGAGGVWLLGPRRSQLPTGVRRAETPALFKDGPKLSDGVAVFATDSGKAFLNELVARLAARRPVLVVAPGHTLPAIDGDVYVSDSVEWEQVELQARGLARATRVPPAVVVLGRDTLTSPGSIADDPARLLADALPAGCWLGVVVAPDAPPVGSLETWRARHDGAWRVGRS